ncbi:Nin one binding Zn-ribbon like-domain-containing protein [Podospora appendiculata]|uniref:20S-pre-rRNA D-site endonuclease NOB1 n=1 Tax=Podospora appendiculata TaxID=314037 RepID=A0AAE1CA15_9PEZI|nr:Nin one binding Zn-ribbon like-domain-containing protein [Podospora appendiculata]
MESPITWPAPAKIVEGESASNETPNPAPTTAVDAVTTAEATEEASTPAAESTSSSAPTTTTPAKLVHSLVIDANAIIKNEPSVSTLLAQSEELYTIPAVVSEIRDEAARSRLQTTLLPFLKLRNPRPESVLFVTNFARRTGDLQVLSKPDIQLLALTYELELERNNGDWRLRNEPNQKRLNGSPPGREEAADKEKDAENLEASDAVEEPTDGEETVAEEYVAQEEAAEDKVAVTEDGVTEQLDNLDLSSHPDQDAAATADVGEEVVSEEDDDEGGWITPSNIKRHQARENTLSAPKQTQRVLQAALITGDMAMRNVALRINLNLLDPVLSRITFLKTWVLRCHGCWKVSKDTSKQFCPSCGHATMTRVSCTTDSAGNFKLHLKKNFVFNKRGNVYSIPKPTHGSPSGKASDVKGGGKNGWGQSLILAEDQKEYIKKAEEDRRIRHRDLMDEDFLPSILSGARNQGNGRIRIGAGRNVNAKKRK